MELSYTDARILYHGITFVEQLRNADAHVFAFGTVSLSEFIEQALEHPCAKTAFLAFASHHLCMITRSTAADQIKRCYIGATCSHLSVALEAFSDENADAVLAASCMLGWATWEKASYAQILQGTSNIVARMLRMQTMGFRSKLSTIFGNANRLPTNDRRVVVAHLSLPEDDLLRMKPLKQELECLIRDTGRQGQIATAARTLLDYIRNVVSGQFETWSEQTGIFVAIHEWTPWVPTDSLGLARRSLPIMTLMALYEAVIIASMSYLPEILGAVFPQKRAEVIGRIYKALCELQIASKKSQTGHAEIDNAVKTATVAMVYAVRYLARNGHHR
ncbi:hypothetical protein LTR49_013236 [Elasticomyces elasticus]|nr:hypothetical protein LTR49_013236 [Elasticomyces elasticus]